MRAGRKPFPRLSQSQIPHSNLTGHQACNAASFGVFDPCGSRQMDMPACPLGSLPAEIRYEISGRKSVILAVFIVKAVKYKTTSAKGLTLRMLYFSIPVVELALCGGVPTFIQTMDAVLEEAEVEFYTLAEEIHEKNPKLLAYIQEKLPDVGHEFIPHTELKKMSANARFAIRTGEFTPYPNIILRAGVAFPA